MGETAAELSILENHAKSSSNQYFVSSQKELSTMEKIIFLKRVPIFTTLSIENLYKIATHIETRFYKDNETIFEENTAGDTFYIIYSGSIELFKATTMGSELKLATLTETKYMGEMAIIEEKQRSSAAKSKGDTVLFEIYKDEFNQLLRECPEMSVSLLKEFSNRIRRLGDELAEKSK